MSLLDTSSHRRLNPLTGEWVIVSPRRTARPWLGGVEQIASTPGAAHDPTCYLCPGNLRANGARNPDYHGVFVFDNDFPALTHPSSIGDIDVEGLLVARAEPGRCRVLCFSERHDLALSRMAVPDIVRVVESWREESARLGALDEIEYVQIFENRGALMGASNPHPHCQIWATRSRPNEIVKETKAQEDYRARKNACLLCDYLALEEKLGERLVCGNAHFVALAPFWAIWPFETMLLPRRHIGAFDELRPEEVAALADILKRSTARYDNLFDCPFPYSMGFHQRPCDGRLASWLAFPCAFLPAAAALGDGAQIHGRLRNARLSSARHHCRGRRQTIARAAGERWLLASLRASLKHGKDARLLLLRVSRRRTGPPRLEALVL